MKVTTKEKVTKIVLVVGIALVLLVALVPTLFTQFGADPEVGKSWLEYFATPVGQVELWQLLLAILVVNLLTS